MAAFEVRGVPGEKPPSRPVAVDLVIQEDIVDSDDGMIRTRLSAPIVVAVLHDGSTEAYEAATILLGRLGDALR